MEIDSKLLEYVKQDLNRIYTEPPFNNNGLDFGWFCREHALHIFLLSHLLGKKSKIISGHIFVKHINNILTTVNTNSDHFWCSIEDNYPVDVSISFEYFREFADITLINGLHNNSSFPYEVLYSDFKSLDALQEMVKNQNAALIYIPQKEFEFTPKQLIEEPSSFLLPVLKGRKSFSDHHGQDIYSMITLHCYKLIESKVKPLSVYCDRISAIKRIKKWNATAQSEIKSLLSI